MTVTQAPTPGPLSGDFNVEEYVADYEFRADEGSYSPTENERALLIDAIHGALSEASLGLAPAPVEASGSEREHGPKCWGMTSASDEMAHCYCGSTDIRPQPSGETRDEVARIVDPAAFLFKADELMKGDTSQYDAFNKADRILALVRPAPVASGDALCCCFGDSGLQASTHHDADDKERCDLCGGLVEAPVAETAGEAVGVVSGCARADLYTADLPTGTPLYAAPVPAQDDDKLRIAAEEFCRRVEAGEIRSKRSYAAFKDALKSTAAQEGGE